LLIILFVMNRWLQKCSVNYNWYFVW